MQKRALSPPLLGKWSPILARCDTCWVDHNHWVTWLTYYVIALYSQKGVSSILQHQWPLNLVMLWVRVKGPHLLFQVTCQSSDYVLIKKCHVSTKARPQNSAGDVKHRKVTNQKLLSLFKRYWIWFTLAYIILKISKLCR